MNLRHPVLTTILLGGFVAGTVDIGAAALIFWANPAVILRAVASGVLGRASFEGGVFSASLGMLLQWGMSFLIAAIFVLASRKLGWMTRRWLLAGLAYGVVVFVVMNYVVVPLSAANSAHSFEFHAVKFFENLAAMLLFGLIISFFARRMRSVAPDSLRSSAVA